MFGQTFYKTIDVPDIGEYVSFFAIQSDKNEAEWSYVIGLKLSSTYRNGGNGKQGDGIDFILKQDTFTIPQEYIDDGDEEGYITEKIIDKWDGVVPDDVEQEFFDDELLLEMDELDHGTFEERFAAVIDDRHGEEVDDFWHDEMERIRKYADANRWEFQ